MIRYSELKEQAWDANQSLFEQGVVLYTFGNVSVVDRQEGVFAIKPSGVPYAKLRPADLVIVDMENKVIDGKLSPSSDTPTHTVLYNAFPGIGGVAHTHSTYATAWAQALKSVPILGTTHADLLPTDIPCTDVMSDKKIKGDYEEKTGLQIVKTFEDLSYQEIEMVLVARHGPFTWGESAYKAVYNSVMLEELCKTAFLTRQINPDTQPLKQSLIDKHYQRKHGDDAYYGQKNE